ncbi:MAG: hypothetical protein JJ975_16930 [Bacteroidia bacterium]|nr:hypothetical protein [Bacteroidia bacterium]
MLIILLIYGSLPYARAQGLYVSVRHNLKSHSQRDEFPPEVTLSLITAPDKRFSFNPELHLDYDIHNRIWPGIGAYKVVNIRRGVGAQMRLNAFSFKGWTIRALIGIGHSSVSQKVKSDHDLLLKYVARTPSKNRVYGYPAIGLQRNLSQHFRLYTDYLHKRKHISLGLSYIFQP